MDALKKSPVLLAIIVLSILSFLAGSFLAFTQMGKVGKAEKKLKSAVQNLNFVASKSPSPTVENVEASAANLKSLEEKREAIRRELDRSSQIQVSEDGIAVTASIQRYILDYQTKAADHIGRSVNDQPGQPMPIKTPDDFAFGFDAFLEESVMLNDPAEIAYIDKQRQILDYLMGKLIEAHPHSIDEVKMESFGSTKETNPSQRDNFSQEGFQISSLISAEVPGAIDTIAFKLKFDGYTDTLRDFLNSLSKFDLPIVIRSVGVERPSGSESVTTTPRNNSDDIFSGFFSDGASAPAKQDKPPIVKAVPSEFTLILEYFEVVLSDDAPMELNEEEE